MEDKDYKIIICNTFFSFLYKYYLILEHLGPQNYDFYSILLLLQRQIKSMKLTYK